MTTMGCGCAKNKRAGAASPPPASALSAARKGSPRVLRQVSSPDLQRRSFSRRSWYVLGPDGSEEKYETLANAQSRQRQLGSGYKIEARRE